MTITVKKLWEAVVEMSGLSPEYLGGNRMIAWCYVAAALERLAAEPQPRELVEREIINKWTETTRDGVSLDDVIALARWAIEQSRPAMCGPTAEEVWSECIKGSPCFYESSTKVFIGWYTSRVRSIAEVTAPLEKRIAERESVIRACQADTKLYKYALAEAEGRIAELEEKNEILQGDSREVISLLNGLGAPDKQDNGLSLHTVGRLSKLVDAIAGKSGVATILDLKSQLAAAKADKPCMTEKEIRNEIACVLDDCGNRCGDIDCRIIADRLRSNHKTAPYGVLFSLIAIALANRVATASKPPCMTEDEMREVVGKRYKISRLRDNLTIRALAGHVADQTAEVTRLRQEASRCIQAAFVGNDTNRYESVSEMLCDNLRMQVKRLGQTVHRREKRLCKCKRIIREHLEYFRKLKEESEPKPEWPKWFEWFERTASGVLYLQFSSSLKFASFDGNGAPFDDGKCWKMSDAEDRNYWLPIPAEPDAVREWREKNE